MVTVFSPPFFVFNYGRDIQAGVFNAIAEMEREGGIMTGFDLKPSKFSKDITKTSLRILKPLLKEGLGVGTLDPELAQQLEEWKQAGGRTGWNYSQTLKEISDKLTKAANDPKRTKKIIKGFRAKGILKTIENINEAFENAIRFAAYIEARKAGATKARAAQLSKNITINFNRAGEASAVFNSMYLFFNAAVQSVSRFKRSVFYTKQSLPGQNGQSDSWYNRIPSTQKIGAGIIGFEILKGFFNIAMSGEDEDGELYYNKIPDYIKERNTIIFYGDGPNDYVAIPLPYGYNIFNNIGQAIADVVAGQRSPEDAALFLGLSASNSFSPVGFDQGDNLLQKIALGAIPTAYKPFVDLEINQSFSGQKILKEQPPYGPTVPNWTLSYRSPEWAVEVAKYLNEITMPSLGIQGGTALVPGSLDFNPDYLFYLIESYTGGLGKTTLQVSGLARNTYEMGKRKVERLSNTDDLDEFLEELTTSREEDMIPIERRDIPILGKMYGSESKFWNYDKYYENANEIRQYMKELEFQEEQIKDAYPDEKEKELKESLPPDLQDRVKEAGDIEGLPEGFTFKGIQKLNEELKKTENALDLLRRGKARVQEIDDYIKRINAVHEFEEAELKTIKEFNKLYYDLRGQYIEPRKRNIITDAFYEREN